MVSPNMASSEFYSGPTSLGYSRYASPQQKKASLVAPSATSASVAASPKADNAIATKEQIAASSTNPSIALDTAEHNADAQLAIANENALKDEVDKHSAKFSRTISSTVTTTRRLLELVREASPYATNAVADKLWNELEELFAAANDARATLPEFLEKQRNNTSLYHTSMMNETIRGTQDELNTQHKKVNIQHSLILEYQEAFYAYKEQTADKLQELEDLHERTSRLTLEKGNLRTELDKHITLLENERSTNADTLHKVDDLEKELEKLVESKKQLLVEADTLRRALEDHQTKMVVDKQEITDNFTTQLKSTADLLSKESQKTTALNTMISQLKGGENTARLEADKTKKENMAKRENMALKDRYDHQASEHANAFAMLNEQTKNLDDLKIDVGRFQKENAELKQRLVKLADLEEKFVELEEEKQAMSRQAGGLVKELELAKDAAGKAKTECEGLWKRVEELQEMSLVAGDPSGEAGCAQEEKIAALETTLHEWTELAKRSYKEYKDMLPAYKLADKYRKDALERAETIKGLELKLTAAMTSQSNGDSSHWKAKYESLLDRVSV